MGNHCSRSAIGRIVKLEDMEGVAAFLASKQTDFVTGQGIVLDGGHTIFPMQLNWRYQWKRSLIHLDSDRPLKHCSIFILISNLALSEWRQFLDG